MARHSHRSTPGRYQTSPHRIANVIVLLVSLFLTGMQAGCARAQKPVLHQPVPHVIQISVDALGGKYLDKLLQESPAEFNIFARLINEGASTLNARTDYTNTSTLPNHTCMLTGRPVKTPADWPECSGHFWEWNGNFPSEKAPASLHATNTDGGYTASAFDVAHDHGLKTALYAGKAKFQVYLTSYGPGFGAEHPRGRNKIDHSIVTYGIHAKALADLKANQPAYAFLHYPEPDSAGHAHGYLGAEYRNALKKINGYLGELLALIETDPEWKNRTVLILSADHGGQPGTKGHGSASHPYNYTIPFIVWGAGIAKGADLYHLNATTRTDPGGGRPPYAPTGQPIRNGDGGNLALKLLGLTAIPSSHINGQQDLQVR